MCSLGSYLLSNLKMEFGRMNFKFVDLIRNTY
jgi:hypothetical protein